jgi:hypothetical protein
MKTSQDNYVIELAAGEAMVARGGLGENCYRAVLNALNLTTGSAIMVENNDIIATACFIGLKEEDIEYSLADGELDGLLVDTFQANIGRAKVAAKEQGYVKDSAERFLVENGLHYIEQDEINDAIFAIRRCEDELNNIRAA